MWTRTWVKKRLLFYLRFRCRCFVQVTSCTNPANKTITWTQEMRIQTHVSDLPLRTPQQSAPLWQGRTSIPTGDTVPLLGRSDHGSVAPLLRQLPHLKIRMIRHKECKLPVSSETARKGESWKQFCCMCYGIRQHFLPVQSFFFLISLLFQLCLCIFAHSYP